MKNLSLLFIAMLAAGLAFSQSFQIIGLGISGVTDTLVIGQAGYQLEAFGQIKNVSGTTKNNVRCKFDIIYMVPLNETKFCFGIYCYSNGITPSSTPVIIAAQDTEKSFKGYLWDSTMSLLSDTIRYTVYDGDNPNDNVSWVVVYAFTTGINELGASSKNLLTNAFPTPSDNASVINYFVEKDAKSAKLSVMNMLGNKVAEYILNTNDSKFEIPTNSLNAGIYFYSLEVDGRVTSTKKLVVNH